jgi:hypothetical protein
MDCPICLDNVKEEDKKIIKCSHVYHKECIDKWFERAHQCPLCRDSKFNISFKDYENHYWEESKRIKELIQNEKNIIFHV